MHHIFTRTRLVTFAISSFVLFIFSLILAFVILPIVIDSQIDKNVRLQRGTAQWHRFQNLLYNLTLNVTFFHISNIDNVTNHGEKPNLLEIGPYIYDEVWTKNVYSYNEDNDTFSYEKNISFYFNKTRSGHGLQEDDILTILNPAYMAVMESSSTMKLPAPPFIVAPLLSGCMNAMFPHGLVLDTASVKEILFEGVPVCGFSEPKCSFLGFNLCEIIESIPSKTLETVTDEDNKKFIKFSFFNYKRKSKSIDGMFESNTGMSNIADVGKIITLNYSNQIDTWTLTQKTEEQDKEDETNSCNYVDGTDGTVFPPHLSVDTTIKVFSNDLCRIVEATYNGTDTYQGIEGFVFKTTSLFNSQPYAEQCFGGGTTLDTNGSYNYFMDGAMDISPCMGAPVLISYPHFLYANESYLKNLTGDIRPDPKKHELFLLIDRYTGTPLSAHQRVQISIILRPIAHYPITKDLPRTVLPLIWIDDGIDLPEGGIDLLNSLLYNTLAMVNILKWVFIGVTLLLTVIACILLWKHIYSP